MSRHKTHLGARTRSMASVEVVIRLEARAAKVTHLEGRAAKDKEASVTFLKNLRKCSEVNRGSSKVVEGAAREAANHKGRRVQISRLMWKLTF